MLFYSFFKTLVGKEIVVELKNDLALRGTLHSVDQYLNIKLLGVQVEALELARALAQYLCPSHLCPLSSPRSQALASPSSYGPLRHARDSVLSSTPVVPRTDSHTRHIPRVRLTHAGNHTVHTWHTACDLSVLAQAPEHLAGESC